MGEDSQMEKADDSLPIKSALEPPAICNKGRISPWNTFICAEMSTVYYRFTVKFDRN